MSANGGDDDSVGGDPPSNRARSVRPAASAWVRGVNDPRDESAAKRPESRGKPLRPGRPPRAESSTPSLVVDSLPDAPGTTTASAIVASPVSLTDAASVVTPKSAGGPANDTVDAVDTARDGDGAHVSEAIDGVGARTNGTTPKRDITSEIALLPPLDPPIQRFVPAKSRTSASGLTGGVPRGRSGSTSDVPIQPVPDITALTPSTRAVPPTVPSVPLRADFDDFEPVAIIDAEPEPPPEEPLSLRRVVRLSPAGRRTRRPRVRRVTRVIRHVDPWSVFKVALCFSMVLYAVCLTAGVLLWNVAYTTGTIDNVERFFESFGWSSFTFKGGQLFHNAWIAGLFAAVGLTGVIVLAATLFNLITDLVGGVRVTVLEEEVVERNPAAARQLLRRRSSQIFRVQGLRSSGDDPGDDALDGF